MTNHNDTTLTTPSEREIVITRVFDAPRDLLWKVWTTTEHLEKWFGPKGWSLPICELDFRVGGEWFYCMAGPEGMQSCGKAVFQAISAPESYVYTDAFAAENGDVNESMPVALITVEFTDLGNGKTLLTDRAVYETTEQRDMVLKMGMQEGTTQMLDKLDEYLSAL